ncbi:proline dehydrogenase [Thermocatellispora tengchongensis]|uniref:Proline dehydrogenase n=1 Tax=Thermocatellispora tengchongensis TaxID=1073253 RepID=A0A840PNV0_9ACTN|nr:proline dehydrogenase family protein [Thermocatellispora tengchongensis]MBB5137705.1 proline dehydrogenase [Thermocatellispora tengchongensis]
MLRRLMLAAARHERAEHLARSSAPVRRLVARYVAGETADDAVRAARGLTALGMRIAVDHLGPAGEDTVPGGQEAGVRAYLDLIDRLAAAGLAAGADVSLRPSALGLGPSGHRAADMTAAAEPVCAAAAAAGATVTLMPEEFTQVEPALEALETLRKEHPDVGVAVQAYLRQAEDHCRALAGPGSRVRLTKGAYRAPEALAYTTSAEVDRSYARCLKILMAGQGHPVIATHDRRLLEIAAALAVLNEREPGGFEYQMPYGVRPAEQRRMAALGAPVRVHVPYGPGWYAHLTRRIAEQPAALGLTPVRAPRPRG